MEYGLRRQRGRSADLDIARQRADRTFRLAARSVVVGAAAAVAVGLLTQHANAAYSAHVAGSTLTVTGDAASDRLALRLAAGHPAKLQVDVGDDGSANFTFARNTFDTIVVQAGAGADRVRIDESNGAFTDVEQTTIDGQTGADIVRGGSFAETLIGGIGNDRIDGNGGDDVVSLGAGRDTFSWNPGDGSDTVDGQAGSDTLRFNGSAASEQMDLSADGSRLRLARDVGSVAMDVGGVENVAIRALKGADGVTVHDLTSTAVSNVSADLAAAIGGTTGDGQADHVVIEGTGAADNVHVDPVSGATHVTGLAAATTVTHSKPASDGLAVNGLLGNDHIAARPGVAKLIALTVDGGDGIDTAEADGTNNAETIQITPAAPAVLISSDGGAHSLRATAENLVVKAFGGNDVVTAGALSGITQLTVDGGAGADTLSGGNGADVLLGGDGNDSIDGNVGPDLAFLGTGNDTFAWDPGDGSDTVEGQAGTDTLRFNGANISEHIDVSANGTRVRFTRDVANVNMDLNGVEGVVFNALGGADVVSVHDLSGTAVKGVTANLAGVPGGNAGDGVADQVVVDGTAAADAVVVARTAGTARVTGLAASVSLSGSDPGLDQFAVDGLDGNDRIAVHPEVAGLVGVVADGGNDVDTTEIDGSSDPDTIQITPAAPSALISNDGGAHSVRATTENLVVNAFGGNDVVTAGALSGITRLTVDGGAGSDTISGSNSADVLLGGDGNDTIDGNVGDDVALLGAGKDTFVWDPGDGSDTVEGQADTDTLRFNGANIAEHIDLSANGGRVRFTRDVANITMDLNDVEKVTFNALGSADVVTVHELTGTDVTSVSVDLAGSLGGGAGDGAADQVVVEGTAGVDHIAVGDNASGVNVTGLSAAVRIAHAEFANDRLDVDTLAGADTVDSSGLGPGVIQLFVDGVQQ
jgi:Ca2+-binding RTX toxin-like protein